jgi:hypothetical protein
MRAPSQTRISPTVFSIALIAFSILWFISAHVFYVSNRDSKDGFFNAPVWTLLFLLLIPAISFLIGPELLKARRVEGQQLSVIDYCGLGAGLAPFVYLSLLIVMFFIKR